MKKHIIAFSLGMIIFAVASWGVFDFSEVLKPEDDGPGSVPWRIHKEKTVEGAFLDAYGEVIFSPSEPYTEDTTHLPVEYSYLLGYNHPSYNVSGLRSTYELHLYDDKETGKGGSVQLTIDSLLQRKAYAALKEEKAEGSIIVLDAKNAEILAMAGRREIDYDINLLNQVLYKENNQYAQTWQKYNNTDSMLLFPATRDFQAPGSVFKTLTSAAAILNGLEDYVYFDTGVLTVDGVDLHNAGNAAYGEENLQSAFIHSTNTYFGSLSLELGERNMRAIMNDFLVGKNIDLGFAKLKSEVRFDGTDLNLALLGYGQGAIALSPLHIAMIGQSIVNDGVMIKPSIVKGLYDANGITLFSNSRHDILTNTLKPEIAQKIKKIMRGYTENDDAKRAASGQKEWSKMYTENIYMKTGTAKESEKSTVYNSYLLCMTDDYVILVSVNNTPKYGANLKPIAEKFLKELY